MELRIAWHRRIAVRLAVLIAAVLLLFAWMAPFLRTAVEYAIGLPSMDTHLAVLHTRWIREELMDGGVEPTPECIETLGVRLAAMHVAFVWLSPAGQVIACSPGMPWHAGEQWPHAVTTMQRLDWNGRSVPVQLTRVFEGEVELGKMATIVLDEPAHLKWHEDRGESQAAIATCPWCNVEQAPLVDEHEYEEMHRSREDIALLSTMAIAVVVALMIGFATSWLVTRRLTRIANAVCVSELSGALPQPLADSRSDEIGTLVSTINRMRLHLQARDKERGDWIAQVSHDLRTPLTALIACLDRAMGSLAEDRDSLNLLRIAMQDAERVQSLAEDLLEIAKLDARIGGVEEPVPAGELLRCVVESLQPWADADGIQLVASVEPDMPLLTADGSRLLRALENLIRNAVQHAEKLVRLSVSKKGSSIEFEVIDDGPGFATDLERVGRDLSAGIGLVVVRRVAEAHRGDCGAENLVPRGARVWLTIPID